MMKNTIRLTEEDLKNIVKESVNRIMEEAEMDEGFWDAMKGAGKKVGGNIKRGTSNLAGKAGSAVNNAGNAIRKGASNLANRANNAMTNAGNAMRRGAENVKGYYNDVKQAGIDASNNADIDKSIKVIEDLMNRQLVNPKAAQMVISSMKKYKR